MDEIVKLAYRLYDDALDAVCNNNISAAVTGLEKSIMIYDKDIAALNLLGLCYYRLCCFNLARKHWIKSFTLDKLDNPAKEYLELLASPDAKKLMRAYSQGFEALSENNVRLGISIFRTIANQYPDLVEPYLILGLSFYHNRRYIKAYRNWRKALSLDRGNIKASQYLTSFLPVKLKRIGLYSLIAMSFVLLIIYFLMR